MFSSVGQFLFPREIPEAKWTFEKAADIHKKERISKIIKAVSYAFMALAIITAVVLFEASVVCIPAIVCLAITAVALAALCIKLHFSEKTFRKNLTDTKRAELAKEEAKKLLFKTPLSTFSSIDQIKSNFEKINRMLEIDAFSKNYLGQLDNLTYDDKSQLSLYETVMEYNNKIDPNSDTRPIKLELDEEKKQYKSAWFGPGTLARYVSVKWNGKADPEATKLAEDDIVFKFASGSDCKDKKYSHIYYKPQK